MDIDFKFDAQQFYKWNFSFWHIEWLCSEALLAEFTRRNLKDDIVAYEKYGQGHRGRVNLQRLWGRLSEEGQRALADWKWSDIDLKTSVPEIHAVISKLNKFASLSRAEQNMWLNKFIPKLGSSQVFPDHYFLFKLQERDFIDLFGLLDVRNADLWISLLSELDASTSVKEHPLEKQ